MLLDYTESNQINFYDKEERALNILIKIVNAITEGAQIEKIFSDNCHTVFEISKADPGIIIGKHGHTLDAIQFILNMIANKEEAQDKQRFYVVDIDGYRNRREESLRRYAKEKAEIVRRKGNPIALYFMNSIERKMVHLALKEDLGVDTYSEGNEPFRRVIITPATISKNYDGQKED